MNANIGTGPALFITALLALMGASAIYNARKAMPRKQRLARPVAGIALAVIAFVLSLVWFPAVRDVADKFVQRYIVPHFL